MTERTATRERLRVREIEILHDGQEGALVSFYREGESTSKKHRYDLTDFRARQRYQRLLVQLFQMGVKIRDARAQLTPGEAIIYVDTRRIVEEQRMDREADF